MTITKLSVLFQFIRFWLHLIETELTSQHTDNATKNGAETFL